MTSAILQVGMFLAAIDDVLGSGAGQALLNELKNARSAQSFQISAPHPGSQFFSSCDGNFLSWNGIVISAYYHPTAAHSATTVGKLGTKTTKAEAGKWAVSAQTRALAGNKAMYNTAGTPGWS